MHSPFLTPRCLNFGAHGASTFSQYWQQNWTDRRHCSVESSHNITVVCSQCIATWTVNSGKLITFKSYNKYMLLTVFLAISTGSTHRVVWSVVSQIISNRFAHKSSLFKSNFLLSWKYSQKYIQYCQALLKTKYRPWVAAVSRTYKNTKTHVTLTSFDGVINYDFSHVQWKQFGELWSTNEKMTFTFDV